MAQAGLSIGHIPPHPPIPWRQGEDWVAEAEQADQLAVVLVDDEVAEAAAIPCGDGDAPCQPGVAEEQLLFAATCDLDEPRRDPLGFYLPPCRETLEQALLVALERRPGTLDPSGTRLLVQRPHRRLVGRLDGATPLLDPQALAGKGLEYARLESGTYNFTVHIFSHRAYRSVRLARSR